MILGSFLQMFRVDISSGRAGLPLSSTATRRPQHQTAEPSPKAASHDVELIVSRDPHLCILHGQS